MKRIMKTGGYCNAQFDCVKDHRCTSPFFSFPRTDPDNETFVCDYWEPYTESLPDIPEHIFINAHEGLDV